MAQIGLLQPLRLRFAVGDYYLGSVAFPSSVQCAPLHWVNPESSAFPLPSVPFVDGLQVIQYPSHPIRERLPKLSLLPGMIRYVPYQYRRYSIDLGGTFEEYLRKFSSKSRFTLKKKVRKFTEHAGAPIDWRTYRGPAGIAEFYRLARQVSEKTYQERLLNAGLPATEEFQRTLREWAENDAVRGYILFDRGKPVAYFCCPVRGGAAMYDYVGYDPDYRELSPGVVLLFLVLEQLFADDGLQLFDFTQGEGPLKEFFSNQFTECADIYYFKRTVPNLLVLGAHIGLENLSRGAGRTLERIGLKGCIKDLMRYRRLRGRGPRKEQPAAEVCHALN